MPNFNGNEWQPRDSKIIPIQDKALSGSGFKVYVVHIEGGITKDEPGYEFCVAGASSLPNIAEIWDEFKLKCDITGDNVRGFVEYLRRIGYVQIEQTVFMSINR